MGVGRALAAAVSALAVVAAASGGASQSTGGLRFGPGTLIDPLRSISTPVLRVAGGGDLWVVGRPGVVVRSTDGGDSFRATVPPPVGPGSVDLVEAAGTIVVASSDANGVAVAGSDDGGASWRRGTVFGGMPATRLWLAADGPTVFMAVTSAEGTNVLSADRSDLAFADAGAPGVVSQSTRCGRLVFDPARRMLHLPCARGNEIELVSGHVAPGRRTGIQFRSAASSSPGGPVGGPLPTVAVDAVGTTHLVWVDAATGALRSERGLLTPGAPSVAALPTAIGGAAGSFAVTFLGSDAGRDPNTLPDVRSDPAAAAAVRWFGYALVVTPAGTFVQRATAKPVHFGRICTACQVDPIVGDTLGISLEPATGALRIALADATDGAHVPQALLVRQLEGPTIVGGSVSRPPPVNGVVDGEGEAPGAPQLDLTKLELRQLNPSTLRVRMSLASAASLGPPAGAATGVWLTRFQVLSRGSAREAAYRSLYAAAVSAGGARRFVTGEIVCAETCRPATARTATGRVEGNTLVVDVNLVALTAAVPLEGDLFYNVSAFTFAGDAGGNPLSVVDSLASFDYRLDQRIGPTTGRGRRIVLRGTIRGGAVGVDVFENRTGRVTFRDTRSRIAFRSTRITRVGVRGRTATISGTGLRGTRRASFVATVVDRGVGRLDSFALRLSSGYRRSGRLTSGNATIRGTG